MLTLFFLNLRYTVRYLEGVGIPPGPSQVPRTEALFHQAQSRSVKDYFAEFLGFGAYEL